MCSNQKRVSMEGTVPFWFEFLDLYKNCRCLWDTEDSYYRSSEKKREALEILLEKYKEINPTATLDVVKKKIDSFRSGWRREDKKVRKSLLSSSRVEDIHVPMLWFYNRLSFLSSTEEEVQRRRRAAELCTEVEIEYNPDTPEYQCPWSPSSSKKMKKEEDDVHMEEEETDQGVAATAAEEEDTDEDAIFAAHIKTQLRQLRKKPKLIAQKLISDVIFLARTDQLTYQTTVHNSSTTQAPNPVPTFNPATPIIITLPMAGALIPNAKPLGTDPSSLAQNTSTPTSETNNSSVGELPVIQDTFSVSGKSVTESENEEKLAPEKLRQLLERKEIKDA